MRSCVPKFPALISDDSVEYRRTDQMNCRCESNQHTSLCFVRTRTPPLWLQEFTALQLRGRL